MPAAVTRCALCPRPVRATPDGLCYRCRGARLCPICRQPSGRGRNSWCRTCAEQCIRRGRILEDHGPQQPAVVRAALLERYAACAAKELPLFEETCKE